MAAIVIPSWTAGIGGQVLKAAGAITSTTAQTAVTVGRCEFEVQADWTACKISANDETYLDVIEANTVAAPTVWNRIGVLNLLGAVEIVVEGDATATGSVRAAFRNPYDYQVRLKTWIAGTLPSVNHAAKLYPMRSLSLAG